MQVLRLWIDNRNNDFIDLEIDNNDFYRAVSICREAIEEYTNNFDAKTMGFFEIDYIYKKLEENKIEYTIRDNNFDLDLFL